jgi:alpha-D-ribose 1-methylphosphonate 5-triphosphate synthase subunit PhnG
MAAGLWWGCPKSYLCHEIFMARRYQVVYYHRQLELGKIEVDVNGETARQERRKAAMRVLAHAPTAAIGSRLDELELPAHVQLREPENGLVMVRGRIGGDGAPFNLGEATVSRAAVRLVSGEVGFGYALGRDREKARLIALCDALIQSEAHAALIEKQVVAPLRDVMLASRAQAAAEAAATRVDFYTMVRGEG